MREARKGKGTEKGKGRRKGKGWRENIAPELFNICIH